MPNENQFIYAVSAALIGAALAVSMFGKSSGPSSGTIEGIVNSRVQQAEDRLRQKIEETKAILQQGAIYTIESKQFYCFPAEEKK